MRIPIRVKLAGALAVPIAGLVAGAFSMTADANRLADDVRDETSLAGAAVGPASLVTQLQNERNFTAVDLIGLTEAVRLPVDSIEEAREGTDVAVDALRRFVAERGPEAEAAFADGLAAVEADLAAVRTRNDEFVGERGLGNNELADEVFGSYRSIVAALLDDTSGIALRVDDADLRTGVELVDLTTRLYELRSTTIRNSVSAVLAGDAGTNIRLATGGALAATDAMERTIVERAVGPYAGLADEAILNDASVERQESLLGAFAAGEDLDVTALLDSIESRTDRGVQLVRQQASSRLLDEAGSSLDAADRRSNDAFVIGASIVVAAIAATWLVSRSITEPLRSLTEQAEAMAGTTLPAAVQQVLDTPLGEDVAIPEVAPIDVKTRDEVRHVAAALNVVQQRALDLALEQALLRRNIAEAFVNMGRRNQNLVDRQLDFITDLEREEADPDTLASLFRLDHLATRMRRNAESLLRLAGSEPQRRGGVPIAIGDVVRGALGEIEDFQRVQVRSLDPAAVPGGVGADLAHALAELLENALSFSPPDEPVEVRGRLSSGGYVLAVTDAGLGMTAAELAVANRRLAGQEALTVAPSRYLGHYVAGHLASRLGMRIELAPGAAGGLVARIDIPASLLVDAEATWPMVDPVDLEPAPVRAPAQVNGNHAPAPALPPAPPPPPALNGHAPAAAPIAAAATAPAVRPPAPAPAPAPVARRAPAPPPPPAPMPAPQPVAHTAAPNGDGGAAAAAVETTASGLVRRVPGAQRPVTDLGLFRPTTEPEAPAAVAPEPEPASSAESVSSFLSSFSSGVARGMVESGRNPWEEDQ